MFRTLRKSNRSAARRAGQPLLTLARHNPAGREPHHAAHQPAPRTGRTKCDAPLPLVAAPRLVPAAGYRATLRSVLVGPRLHPASCALPASWSSTPASAGSPCSARSRARGRTRGSSMRPTTRCFPMAEFPEDELIARVVALMDELIDDASARPRGDRLQHRLDAGAAARCARASPCPSSAPCRRSSRPARRRSRSASRCSAPRRPSAREYTRALIRNFASGCDVTLVGSARLAALAEAELRGRAGRRRGDRAPRSRPASSTDGGGAPTRSCSPARTIRCCSTASSGSRPGR